MRIAVISIAIACAPATPLIQPTIVPGVDPSARRLLGTASPGMMTTLSAGDRQWIERTLASLTLREKIGQLIMPWVAGDYTAVG
ncbi:MAG TPA: hypothetical protein VK478_17700, partial [Gemmatimonadaceae bacterium]|nr:hypothetical protein [Gemmatimonadaceae bacterium]